MEIKAAIEGRLKNLAPVHFEFRDDSHLHIGHPGNKGGGHFSILVVSNRFNQTGRLERQRMVKSLLRDLFSDGLIHALSIKAVTPEEHSSSADMHSLTDSPT